MKNFRIFQIKTSIKEIFLVTLKEILQRKGTSKLKRKALSTMITFSTRNLSKQEACILMTKALVNSLSVLLKLIIQFKKESYWSREISISSLDTLSLMIKTLQHPFLPLLLLKFCLGIHLGQ